MEKTVPRIVIRDGRIPNRKNLASTDGTQTTRKYGQNYVADYHQPYHPAGIAQDTMVTGGSSKLVDPKYGRGEDEGDDEC